MASPIEDRLFNALCAAVPSWSWCDEPTCAVLWEDREHRTRARSALLLRQQAVLTYRADFVMVPAIARHVIPPVLAIECDGHDFHDRTKQQAAYDRARDRELLLRGVTTIRFTGSEIHHSPERCAASVIDVYSAVIHRAARARAPESYLAAWGG